MNYEESLRLVGALLDREGAEFALIDVRPDHVTLQYTGRAGVQESDLAPSALAGAHEAACARRGASVLTFAHPTDFEAALRSVGVELDASAETRCGLTVSRQEVLVTGNKAETTFTAQTLADRLRATLRR
ncbi:MAG TPA: hypothetical protein VII06_04740 [Chloroflexota bacterium]